MMEVYHYTTYQSLLGIVDNHDGKIVLWATRFDSLNDPTDCIFARNVVMPIIFKEWQKRHPDEKADDYYSEAYPYVISFTRLKDDEFMWRHYGSQVCLSFNADILERCQNSPEGKNLASWAKCHYIEEETDKQEVIQIADIIRDALGWSDNSLMDYQETCAFIKRKAFMREEEWRMVQSDHKNIVFHSAEEREEKETSMNTLFRCNKKGDIIPYKEFTLPGKALSAIIINEPDPHKYALTKKHIELLLVKNHLDHCEIRQSNIYPI